MRRVMILCMAISSTAFVLATAGVAVAGGGCHSGVTHDDASGEKVATVRMVDACFSASITKVDPGTSVTFVHDDAGITHNVGGNQWGHFDEMSRGDTFTATFAEAGVYPFACTYHPGMTGAIVVGDGTGAGSGAAISVEPFEAPAPQTVTRVVAGDEGLPGGLLVAAGVLGLALGAGIALGLNRSGRKSVTA
jgi:plastocyanin